MADIDFFGYQRSKVGTYIMSSDYASIYFANTAGGTGTPSNRAGLVQSSSVSYQHRVEPKFEAGSHELYWLTGQSMGAIALGRLVSERGFMDGIQSGGAANALTKGIIGTVEFKAGQVNLRQDVVTMSGCVLQGVNFNTSVGGLEITESLTIQVALMQKKNTGNGGLIGVVQNAVGALFGAQ